MDRIRRPGNHRDRHRNPPDRLRRYPDHRYRLRRPGDDQDREQEVGQRGDGERPHPEGQAREHRDRGHRERGQREQSQGEQSKRERGQRERGQRERGQRERGQRERGRARAAIRPGPRRDPSLTGTRPGGRRAGRRAGRAPRAAEADAARLPWYEVAHAKRVAEGYQNCGPLERVLRREWPPSKVPSAPVVRAVNRLAELPLIIKQILAAGVDAIHVGEGGVPELDDMSRLRGVPLPSGRATWDACAGAYGEKKIIVGSRPSSAPDVMCHEVGHALDDIDREKGRWQSDSAEFRRLYDRCEGSLVSDFHRQAGDLGRREFFADAFAAIASRQRPALVDMLGGNIRTALDVMLYFNLRYGL